MQWCQTETIAEVARAYRTYCELGQGSRQERLAAEDNLTTNHRGRLLGHLCAAPCGDQRRGSTSVGGDARSPPTPGSRKDQGLV